MHPAHLGDLLKPIMEIQAFFLFFFHNLANLVHFLEKKILNRWKSDFNRWENCTQKTRRKKKTYCQLHVPFGFSCWVFLDLVIYKLTLSLVPSLALETLFHPQGCVRIVYRGVKHNWAPFHETKYQFKIFAGSYSDKGQ
jgi:hypothetical protein